MSSNSTHQPGLGGSPPQLPPTPQYPLGIPQIKMSRAVKLYMAWVQADKEEVTAKHLARKGEQSVPRLQPNPQHLPTSPIAGSPQSPSASWTRPPSVAGSARDGMTESVIDFTTEITEVESNASGRANEPVAFTGKPVKAPRERKPLPPAARAKAALKRHLEACALCRFRRVPCPMNHHDMDALKRAAVAELARVEKRRRAGSHTQEQTATNSTYTMSMLSQGTTQLPTAATTINKSYDQQSSLLAGIGDSLQHGQSHSQLAQSLPLSIHSGSQSPMLVDDIDSDPLGFNQPWANYPYEGQEVLLGIFRPIYRPNFPQGYAVWACQYEDGNGLCNHTELESEGLQNHFATHMAFTRLTIAMKYKCSICGVKQDHRNAICTTFNCIGILEQALFGRYQRQGPVTQTQTNHNHVQNDSFDFSSLNDNNDNPGITFTQPSRANTYGDIGFMDDMNAYGGHQRGSSNSYYSLPDSYQSDDNTQGYSPHDGGNFDLSPPTPSPHYSY